MSTDHRIEIAEAARRMDMNYARVLEMVRGSKLDGGRDRHGWWVDDRAVTLWLENTDG